MYVIDLGIRGVNNIWFRLDDIPTTTRHTTPSGYGRNYVIGKGFGSIAWSDASFIVQISFFFQISYFFGKCLVIDFRNAMFTPDNCVSPVLSVGCVF